MSSKVKLMDSTIRLAPRSRSASYQQLSDNNSGDVSSTGSLENRDGTRGSSSGGASEKRWFKRRNSSRRDLAGSSNLTPDGSVGDCYDGRRMDKGSVAVESPHVPTHSIKKNQNSITETEDLTGYQTSNYPPPQWVDRLHILAASNAATSEINGMLVSSRPPKPESIWAEAHRKERTRLQKSKKTINPSILLQLADEIKESSPKTPLPRPSTQILKPKLQRNFTAPSTPTVATQLLKPSHAVDDALMHRAFCIRDNLRQFEMQELAMEAELAAASGQKKFVGSASKFGAETTPTSKQFIYADEFIVGVAPGPPLTPRRKRSSLVACYGPMDSYLNRKKIHVKKLRNLSEVVPGFNEMHNNIRIHLRREGVDARTLPEDSTLKRNAMGAMADLEEEDVLSQASSLNISQAGSMNSFSSHAVASLKGIVEYVGRSKSSHDNLNPASSSRQRSISSFAPSVSFGGPLGSFGTSGTTVTSTIHELTEPGSDQQKEKIDSKKSSSTQTTTTMDAHSVANSDDSDDSSVELYRWKASATSSNSQNDHASSMDDDILMGRWKNNYSRSVSESCGKSRVVLERKNLFKNFSLDDDKESLLNSPQPLSPSSLSFVEETNFNKNSKKSSNTPVAQFLSKIQHKFSRSPDDDRNKRRGDTEEDNKRFIVNYFYTCQQAKIDESIGICNLKLDINPDGSQRDAFCMPGCGQNDLMASCATVSTFVDMVFNWFNEKGGGSQTSDDQSSQIILHPNWVRTWQTYSGNDQRRFFMPPRLRVHHEFRAE